MGGRITRAIYKTQRQSDTRRAGMGNDIRQLSIKLSVLMSALSSFLMGYLYRAHANLGTTSSPAIDNKQHPNAWSQTLPSYSFSFALLAVQMTFISLLFDRRGCMSMIQQIEKFNSTLLISSLSLLLIDVVLWLFDLRLDFIYALLYGLMLLSISTITLFTINNVSVLGNKRQSNKLMNNANNKQSQLEEMCKTQVVLYYYNKITSLKRAIFVIMLMLIFSSGIGVSQHIRQLRVRNMIQQLVRGNPKLIAPDGDSYNPDNQLLYLPLQYQSYVLQQQHEQKLTLRIIFSFLIIMVNFIVVVLQKKSLVHLFFYDRKKKELYLVYEQKMLEYVKNTNQDNHMNNVDVGNKVSNNSKQSVRATSFSNTSTKSAILISSLCYFISLASIQHQIKLIKYHVKTNHAISFQQFSFSQQLLHMIVVAVSSYLLIRLMLWCKYKIIGMKVHNSQSNNVRFDNNPVPQSIVINIHIVSYFTFFLLIKSIQSLANTNTTLIMPQNINTINKQSISTNTTQKNSKLPQTINNHLPLFTLQCLSILLTYYFMKLNKDLLMKFPQWNLARQPHLTVACNLLVVVKLILSYEMLQTISRPIIDYTIMPVIKMGTYTLNIIFDQGDANIQTHNYDILCIQIIVFSTIIILILYDNENHNPLINSFKHINTMISNQNTKNNQKQTQIINLNSTIKNNTHLLNHFSILLDQLQLKEDQSSKLLNV